MFSKENSSAESIKLCLLTHELSSHMSYLYNITCQKHVKGNVHTKINIRPNIGLETQTCSKTI